MGWREPLDKTLLYCPDPAPYDYLKPNSRYLFKRSSHNYPEQFWMEIFAYRLGSSMDVPVPPAFTAYDSKADQSAALIEWFLSPTDASSTPGGDYCQQYIPDFDRKKGKQHNFATVIQIFEELQSQSTIALDWKEYWAKAFLFDALIGNTDRHQDNWCVIETPDGYAKKLRLCPVFDNGTSMGHEIKACNFNKFDTAQYIENYVSKGWHHMKWTIADTQSTKHCEMLIKLIEVFPEAKKIMLDCLKMIDESVFERILSDLIKFNVPVVLTTDRASFMLKLLNWRYHRILKALGC